MSKELIMAVNQICAEKELPRDVILGAIEEALIHAYRRNYANATRQRAGDRSIRTRATCVIVCEKTVVETVQDPARGDYAAGSAQDRQGRRVGRHGAGSSASRPISAASPRRPPSRSSCSASTRPSATQLYDFYKQREGELITGQVQSIDYRSNAVTVTLSKKAEGIIAAEDQLPNDRYRVGMNVRTLLAEVNKGTRGPQIRLSRTHRNMLRRLLEREIPEIYNGTVEIKSIAREPGQRSKVAVFGQPAGGRSGRLVRRAARHAHPEHRRRAERREDRRGRVVGRRAQLHQQRAQPGQADRHDPDRRRRHADGHRRGARPAAFAGHRQGRPERPPCGQADRLAHRHQERDRGRHRGPGRDQAPADADDPQRDRSRTRPRRCRRATTC